MLLPIITPGAFLPSYTYNDRIIDPTTASTYVFSGVDIGLAAATRFVIIGIITRASAALSISSVTIGGNAATELIRGGSGTNQAAAFYGLLVPSGTSASVQVALSRVCNFCAISSYSLFNLSSTTPADTATSINVTPLSLDADTSKNAIVLGLAHQGSSLTTTFTWTGLTERYDEAVDAVENASWCGADDLMTSAETPRTISVSFSVAPTVYRGGALIVMR